MSIQLSSSLEVLGTIQAIGFTGSLQGTASYSATASFLIGASTASYLDPLIQDVEITGSLKVNGDLYANTLYTTYETSSIIYSSGSTKFGNSLDDTHQFTGSVSILGNLNAANITGSLFGTASVALSSSYSLFAEDIVVYAKNPTATPITKGQVVRITGGTGTNPEIGLASYTDDANSANTLGVANEAIGVNGFGNVLTQGRLLGVDFSAYTIGQLLYLGFDGAITGSAPVAPSHSVRLGQVLRNQNNGAAYIDIDNGYELGELHDVSMSMNPATGSVLAYNGTVWTNTTTINATSSLAQTASYVATASYIFNLQDVTTKASSTTASVYISASFLQGNLVSASGSYSHAQGLSTHANGGYAHAEGWAASASALYSHAEGQETFVNGQAAHAEGLRTRAIGNYSHAEGNTTTAVSVAAHAEGQQTTAFGTNSHAEGQQNLAFGYGSHAEGNQSTSIGQYAHAEGFQTTAPGNFSHAEGNVTTAQGAYSHAEGSNTRTVGAESHAEGYLTWTIGQYSHAEGQGTTASGSLSHAEGYQSFSIGSFSHAEGWQTRALATASHAEGFQTTTKGIYSHAQGFGTVTSASYQTAMGEYNTINNEAIVVIGGGTSDTNRNNIVEFYASGSIGATLNPGVMVLPTVSSSLDFLNDAAAAAAAVPLGGVYRNGNVLAIRIV